MVITESELREIWRDGKYPLPPFPVGTGFTPSALDFLAAHNLQVQYFSPDGLTSPQFNPPPEGGRPDWDKPGDFPVILTGPAPVCSVCGQPVQHKPEHMTQLDAGHFTSKTSPRIKLRGRLDSLHALVMLVSSLARNSGLPQLAGYLDTLAAYCREIQSSEYHNRPVSPLQLAGKSEEEIHEISHHPDRCLGIAHIVPGSTDLAILHWLNYLRTQSREVEILSLEVYPPPEREDLARSLNRVSSAVYYLELLFKVGKIGWDRIP